MFRPTFSSLTRGTDSLYIEKWKSLGLNDESKLPAVKNTSNNTPKIVVSNEKIGIRFSDGDYFKQEKLDYIRNKVINVCIVYKLTPRIITEDGIIQTNGLFGNLKIGNTKNTLHYRYYDGIGVFFDATGSYGGTGVNEFRNLILYGADMKNSSYSTNKKHPIFILGKSFTQGLQYGATIYAEHDYVKVNGSQANKKFILSVHYNGGNSYLFINGVISKQFQFKAMSSLKADNLFVIGNTSTNFSNQTDYQKASLPGDIYDVLVSYEAADTKNIYDIHRYLMKKHDISSV